MDAENSNDKGNMVKIVCSVIPGFEKIAMDECKERCALEATRDQRGRITFKIDCNQIHILTALRSVHHYWVVVGDKENFFSAGETKEEIFEIFSKLPTEFDWSNALQTWKRINCFRQSKEKTKLTAEKKAKQDDAIEELDYNVITPQTAAENIRFRCTATRNGEHVFSSVESACHVGGGINDFFNWKVDLTNFHLEVVVYIVDDFISVGIQLTRESQSLRNVTHFGPTTLKANICYCLLKMTQAKPGDVVCDPMSGGCSIPLEGAYSFPFQFHLGGDNHAVAVEHSRENMESMCVRNSELSDKPNCTLNMSVMHWDVYHLPLRDACVDHIVTDLPFGKKMGNKDRNLFLYPIALGEMARVCRARGKAILLTQDKKAMKKALDRRWNWWRLVECRMINMGGMKVAVYILVRSDQVYDKNEFGNTRKKPNKPETIKNTGGDLSTQQSVRTAAT